MKVASITVEHNSLNVTQQHCVTRGMVGATVVFEQFSPDWNGLSKTAVFRTTRETRDVVNILEGEPVVIPWELLENAGDDLMVGVCGSNQDRSMVLTSVWGQLGKISPGAGSVGRPSEPPTPTWSQQIEGKVQNALEQVQRIIPAVESAEKFAVSAENSANKATEGAENIHGFTNAAIRAAQHSEQMADTAVNSERETAQYAHDVEAVKQNVQNIQVQVNQAAQEASAAATASEDCAVRSETASTLASKQAERAERFAGSLEASAAASYSLGVTNAKAGQIFRVEQVDNQGRVTQWIPEPDYELIYEEEVLKPVAQVDKWFPEKYTAMRIGVKCPNPSDKKETLYITAGNGTVKGVGTPYNMGVGWDSMMKIEQDHGIWNVIGMHGADSYGKTEVVGPVGCAAPVIVGYDSFQFPFLNRVLIYILGGSTIDLHTRIQVWGRK